jgi:hypothetical protein
MRPITPAVAVLQVIIVLVALLFVGATFAKPWVYARWIRVAFRIFGFATLVFTGLTLLMGFHAFPWAVFWALYSLKMLFMGLASGMLLLFFLSGEAVRGFRRWRELRRQFRAQVIDSAKA